MSREVLRHPLARADLVEHFAYIYSNHPSAADRFLAAVERAFGRLADHPEIGSTPEWLAPRLTGVRRWPVPGFSNYLIFYRPSTLEIVVIRVLHGARDIERALGEGAPDV